MARKVTIATSLVLAARSLCVAQQQPPEESCEASQQAIMQNIRSNNERINLLQAMEIDSLQAHSDELKINMRRLENRPVPKSLLAKLARDTANVRRDQDALHKQGLVPIPSEDRENASIEATKTANEAILKHNAKYPGCQLAELDDILQKQIQLRAETAALRAKYVEAEQAVIDSREKARADAEENRLKATCHRLYAVTANKRVSDLTVLQAKQIQACTVLGYYEAR